MDTWADLQGPPRKRMRKGTKSCAECMVHTIRVRCSSLSAAGRRRKIRCTFDSDRPGPCNECRSRGSSCIDQEHISNGNNTMGISAPVEQPYSLRERVAHLESVVENLVKRLDHPSSASSPYGQAHRRETNQAKVPGANLTPVSTEPDELGPSSDQIRSAPVLQLFDNYLVSRREDPSDNDKFAGVKDMSPKAQAVRAELVALLPPLEDISTLISASDRWHVWQSSCPELGDRCLHMLAEPSQSPVAPAEIAKALVCLCISVVQAPSDFDFDTLKEPFDTAEFVDRCTAAIDRLVVRDDDLAATLPGIETQMLLSKFHLNEGRMRKAWLVNRRAIEFAHLAGMHLSTKTPRPSDSLYERRLRTWCSLGSSDRSLSLILGLPYGIADAFILPQIEQRLSLDLSAPEQYMLRIGIITGHMIDRNQNPSEMSLPTTLRLDQELQDAWNAMPGHLRSSKPEVNEERAHFYERIPLQFMFKLLRAFLHLPFMLKSPSDSRFRYCHASALESAREGLALYMIIRSSIKPYLCKMIDFLAFTLGMLIILHLFGYSEESPDYNQEQDERDWELVGKVVEVLRRAATEPGGSVAAESANILGTMFDARLCKKDWSLSTSCKITIPYFGTITVGAGTKYSKAPANKPKDHASDVPTPPATNTTPSSSSSKPSPHQLYTPPMSDLDGAATASAESVSGSSTLAPNFGDVGYTNETWTQREDGSTNPFVGLEVNAFSGLFDDFGQYMWPNLNVDLGLDQGWNLNWSEDGVP
ncbi:hypothetical protein NUU61_006524 [Penicillium alfredii]|uniref:Zn(2)-C6 fungal-type domain-containing protein n=1 Tax=Penicillium alfredii TaxID=1506179 RepID=A0A9W9F134_9EURO|nr:uncharacterized protein NUU61_006524 [Penicillium alfredii]KAJ5091654.1 hypothetical protein NUU61_006524 [Penicillium alfredii]